MAPAARPWFEPLVRTFEGPALRFALMLVRDRAIAEEIVQEAFARVWASPKTPSEEVEFRRWLFRAISNLATDHVRRNRSSRRRVSLSHR
jgi:RNA polymerase sigma-70 factor (ECF subfamily)